MRANKANYTTVKELGLSNLIDYINDHAQLYLNNVSLAMANNIYESEGTILHFVNHSDVTEDIKVKFVSRQKLAITKLSDVKDEYLSLVLVANGFVVNWGNIIYYYKVKKGIDEHLFGLLNSPKVIKAKGFLNVTLTDQSDWQELTELLTEILANEKLETISFQKLLTILPDPAKLAKILVKLKDEERKHYLLENLTIPINPESTTLLESVHSDFFVSFLGKYAIQIRQLGLGNPSWEKTILNSQAISDKEKENLIYELFHVSEDDEEGDTGQGI